MAPRQSDRRTDRKNKPHFCQGAALSASHIFGHQRRMSPKLPGAFIHNQSTVRSVWTDVMPSPEEKHRQPRQTVSDVKNRAAGLGRLTASPH
jgi:hypothetical protein